MGKPTKLGCSNGVQVKVIPMEQSTLVVEVIPGIGEYHVKFSAKGPQKVITAEGLVIEIAEG